MFLNVEASNIGRIFRNFAYVVPLAVLYYVRIVVSQLTKLKRIAGYFFFFQQNLEALPDIPPFRGVLPNSKIYSDVAFALADSSCKVHVGCPLCAKL